jgi:hypothetical protein
MPVIINEFEVVTQPPQRQAAESAQPDEATPAQPPTPQDIERVMRHAMERLWRVWAQ